ncbi:MAG: hypothetical protein WB919_07830 [Candidatus Sulfotelmatobacter sp.]
MKKILCCVVVGICLTGISAAQTAAQSQTSETATAPSGSQPSAPLQMKFTPGTLIRAELEKPVDAKKAKVGDQVLAKTTDDLNSTPPGLAGKGCKIVGHVVEVAPHQGNSVSTLRIVFDKMILKNGSEMPLPATIKAVGFADDFNPATDSEMITQMGNGPGVRIAPPPGGVIGAGSGTPSQYGGERLPSGNTGNPDAKLPFNAKGAIGMSGVDLSSGTAQDSVLSSKKRTVKLENGMQMILRVD